MCCVRVTDCLRQLGVQFSERTPPRMNSSRSRQFGANHSVQSQPRHNKRCCVFAPFCFQNTFGSECWHGGDDVSDKQLRGRRHWTCSSVQKKSRVTSEIIMSGSDRRFSLIACSRAARRWRFDWLRRVTAPEGTANMRKFINRLLGLGNRTYRSDLRPQSDPVLSDIVQFTTVTQE